MSIYYTSNLTSNETNSYEYSHLKIYDSGLGFNNEELENFEFSLIIFQDIKTKVDNN